MVVWHRSTATVGVLADGRSGVMRGAVPPGSVAHGDARALVACIETLR